MGFAVLERRLKRGATEAYLSAIAELCRAIAGAPGLIATTTYVSDGDAPAALNVAEWRRRSDHFAAQRLVPEEIGQAPRAFTMPAGDQGWIWFEQRYLVRDMGARVGLCAATRYALTPDQVRGYLESAAASARAALEVGTLAGLALLERADAPGHFLALEEFRDEAACVEHRRRQTTVAGRSRLAPEPPVFSGSTAHQWPRLGDKAG